MQKAPVIKDLQGNIIAPYDLPAVDTVRWTPNLKAIVVRAVHGSMITLEEALNRYHMTEKEFLIWEQGLKDEGKHGLKVTHFQRRRRAEQQK